MHELVWASARCTQQHTRTGIKKRSESRESTPNPSGSCPARKDWRKLSIASDWMNILQS